LRTKQEVVVKQISKQGQTVNQIEDFRIEIEMYKLSVHPYVVRLLDHFENKESIYLVLEKHQGNDLEEYL
jgi:serine/threonine protein kinase